MPREIPRPAYPAEAGGYTRKEARFSVDSYEFAAHARSLGGFAFGGTSLGVARLREEANHLSTLPRAARVI